MNVLVVDDMEDVVKGILSGINWRSLGISGVYPAYCATQARKVLRDVEVDILLCDIEMPDQSGLELLRWVREQKKEIECIFLTSHAEFAYAKQALELSSFAYILQPAPYEEISEAVREAADKILRKNREHSAMQYGAYWADKKKSLLERCLRSFLYNMEQDVGQLVEDLDKLGYPLRPESVFLPVLLQFLIHDPDGEEMESALTALMDPLPEGDAVITVRLDRQDILLLLPSREDREEALHRAVLSFLSRVNEGGAALACYTGLSAPLSGLAERFQQLQKMRRENVAGYARLFLQGQDADEQDSAAEQPRPDLEHWIRLLSSGGGEEVRSRAHRYLDRQKQQGAMSTELLARFHQDFVYALSRPRQGAGNELLRTHFDAYLQSYTSLEAMHRFVDAAIDSLSADPDSPAADISPVRRAVEYINQNLEKNLNRSQIAEEVHLNPEYFSRLFKQEMGVSLMDFVAERKLEIARSLLADTAIPVYLVASKVGFTNISYFSKVFKKHTGLAPIEYRQQNGK